MIGDHQADTEHITCPVWVFDQRGGAQQQVAGDVLRFVPELTHIHRLAARSTFSSEMFCANGNCNASS